MKEKNKKRQKNKKNKGFEMKFVAKAAIRQKRCKGKRQGQKGWINIRNIGKKTIKKCGADKKHNNAEKIRAVNFQKQSAQKNTRASLHQKAKEPKILMF